MFGQNLLGETWGRCTQAYIGVWEEYRRIKIKVRDKIRVCLKNEIP
jgi:hypothetical protein